MIIGFTGSQSGMTQFQQLELGKILQLKGCSEFLFYDTGNSNNTAAHIALNEGVKLFTIYPPEDLRKQFNTFDPHRKMKYNRIETPYIDYTDLKVKWMPVDKYFKAHEDIINKSALFVACPKEFKFAINSAVWGAIKHAWKTKKDVIIIPPIERENEEYSPSLKDA